MGERGAIHQLQFAPHRHPVGDAAHLDTGRTSHVGDIPGGGIPFDGGVGGEDKLADGLVFQPSLQDLQP